MLCSFSGALAELPRGKRTPLEALRVLQRDPAVSTLDLSENRWLLLLVRDMLTQGLIESRPDVGYPWLRYELTREGLAMLAKDGQA
jgi:hypothetical protein